MDDGIQRALTMESQTVRRFRYTTRLQGATYALDLALYRAQLTLTVPAPYLLSIGASWDRVCCAGNDLTRLLDRTDHALRTTLPDLSWRLRVIATEDKGVLTATAPLCLDALTAEQVRAVSAQLPRGTATRTWRRYDRRTRQERQYFAVADAGE